MNAEGFGLAAPSRHVAQRKRALIEHLKQDNIYSEREKKQQVAEIKALARDIPGKNWLQLGQELSETAARELKQEQQAQATELEERVTALETRLDASAQATGTPERLAELAELLTRLDASAQRAQDILAQLNTQNSALEQAAAQQAKERAEQQAELDARRTYLAQLLYETPGAERERLIAATGKTLSELNAELARLEDQLL